MEVGGGSREGTEPAREATPVSFKERYRELKSRFKYLIYVSVSVYVCVAQERCTRVIVCG